MGIIPKKGEEKESLGVIGLVVVHYILGLGILVIGQRTKNVLEFWGGLVVFLFAIGYLILGFTFTGSPQAFHASLLASFFGLFSLMTWLYIIVRLIWIFVKKETKLAII